MECHLCCFKNENVVKTFFSGSVFKFYLYLQPTVYKMKMPLATSEGQQLTALKDILKKKEGE